MAPASLHGFALVLIVVAWGGSALAGGGLWLGAARLRARGATVERAVLELAVLAPPLIAAAITIVLIARSTAGADHCLDHAHHAHLCLVHGAAWGDRAWVVAVVALVGAAVAARGVVVVGSLLHGRRVIAAMGDASAPADRVRLVDTAIPFCFVAGLRRPAIYVSSATWRALDPAERAAVLAHERAHLGHRDLWRRLGLELGLVLAAPLLATIVRRRWITATEKLRDAEAAEAVGSRADVAQAMVTMARLGSSRHRSFACFIGPGDVVGERVEAVLGGSSVDRRPGRLVLGLACGATLVVAAATAGAGALHHLFESLLG